MEKIEKLQTRSRAFSWAIKNRKYRFAFTVVKLAIEALLNRALSATISQGTGGSAAL